MYTGKLAAFEKKIFELHSAFGDFGACVAVSIAATHGLGKSDETCTDDSLKKVQQGLYGMEIFHTLTIGLAKLSLIALFSLLLSPTQMRKMIIATATFLVLWTLAMVVATTVQCSPPDVWDLAHGSCINTAALWRYFGATNILIETLMFATLIVFVARLHMKKWTRVMGYCRNRRPAQLHRSFQFSRLFSAA
ncbi:hypothetical protein N7456_008901 [Penicillium angulare]|uniref:Rhodopsin domain-containing protein n=1 Tax=Penicillium angulare TaxID=116970 RepID=A0A9W9F3X3_9EURO|nr:hypothetical protein N7456_008901 [Penicillium angulare]